MLSSYRANTKTKAAPERAANNRTKKKDVVFMLKKAAPFESGP
jgi:hypothetical protein